MTNQCGKSDVQCLLEFRELIQILKKTENFHLVAASTPGYLFSEIPIDEPFDQIKVGDHLNELMKNLGYGESYAIQGEIPSRIWSNHLCPYC